MAVGEEPGLAPPVQSLTFLVLEQGHDALLVEDIGLLAHERSLHLVDGLLEELLVFSDEQFLNVLEAALPLADRVDLDTLDEDLDQGSGLRELGPCQRQAVERDREGLLRGAADHELEDGYAERVDIFQHDHLLLLAVRDLLLLLREGPVAGLSAEGSLHGGNRGEVSDFVHDILVLLLKNDLAEVELAVDQARVVSKIEPLGQLDGHIVDELDVGSWNVNGQVEVQTLDVLEDVTAVCVLDHRKVGTAQFLSETVEGRGDVCVSLQVNPLGDVFVVGDLADYELLTEVLVVDHVRRVTNHMLHLLFKKRGEK